MSEFKTIKVSAYQHMITRNCPNVLLYKTEKAFRKYCIQSFTYKGNQAFPRLYMIKGRIWKVETENFWKNDNDCYYKLVLAKTTDFAHRNLEFVH